MNGQIIGWMGRILVLQIEDACLGESACHNRFMLGVIH